MKKEFLKIKTALISVYDKEGIVDFCKELERLKIKMISTGKTAQILKNSGIKATEIKDYTEFPEILEGRVKTLHSKIFGGVLARKEKIGDLKSLKSLGIETIDMVVVNLYPFKEKSAVLKDLKEILEFIDIGGPSLLRAGAKNFLSVCVVPSREFYREVIRELKENKGKVSLLLRKRLAKEVFKITTLYDYQIFKFFSEEKEFTQDLLLHLKRGLKLRYGENPHQKAYLYTYPEKEKLIEKLQGKELSFNNFLDIKAVLNIFKDFKESCCVIMKHNSPCGLACDKDLKKAFLKAYLADSISAFGGIVGFNRRVTEQIAKEILKTGFKEIILAPFFTKKALKVFSKKKRLIVCKINLNLKSDNLDFREIELGFLVQEKDTKIIDKKNLKIVTSSKPSKETLEDLIFAFKVVKYLKSNAICIAKDKRTLGVCGGQPSRIDAVKIAIQKAGDCKGAVLASDGFFPQPDSIQEAFKAKIKAIVQPGGSIKDREVIEACNKYKISMVFTGIRHFLH